MAKARGAAVMLKRLALTFAAAALVTWPSSEIPRLVWNGSASAPLGLYAIVQDCPCPTGTLVLIRAPEAVADDLAKRGLLTPSMPLLKRVAAGPGQRVCRSETLIIIDDLPSARARLHDLSGNPLPRWSGCHLLRQTEFFLLNKPPLSYDSRYFGPVTAENVLGRARPLLTWVAQS
jgi:conjugative transfer signal peptidase TraF